jgi:hypothetical protein
LACRKSRPWKKTPRNPIASSTETTSSSPGLDGRLEPVAQAPAQLALVAFHDFRDTRREVALDVQRGELEERHHRRVLAREDHGAEEVVGELALEARRDFERRHAVGAPVADPLLEQVEQELLFRAVVVVEARLGEADAFGQLAHRDAVVPLLREESERRLAQAGAGRDRIVARGLAHGLRPNGRKRPTGRECRVRQFGRQVAGVRKVSLC